MAGEEYELTLGDVKRDVLQGEPPFGEGLEDVRELDHRLQLRQAVGKIGDEVVGVLQSDRKSQEAIGNASPRPRLRREHRVRGQARLGHERLYAAETRGGGPHPTRAQAPLGRPRSTLVLSP